MILVVFAIICLITLLCATWITTRDGDEPRCPKCNYSLKGLPQPVRCPECATTGDGLYLEGAVIEYSGGVLRLATATLVAPLLGWVISPLTWMLMYRWAGWSWDTALRMLTPWDWFLWSPVEAHAGAVAGAAWPFVVAYVVTLIRIRGDSRPWRRAWVLQGAALVASVTVTALTWWGDRLYWSGNEYGVLHAALATGIVLGGRLGYWGLPAMRAQAVRRLDAISGVE